jgi:hypothetical protein
MAINEDATGLEVTVRTNQQPLQEYECPDAQDNDDPPLSSTMTRYVECIDNAEFDICVQVHPSYVWGYRNHVLVANVYVDGKLIRGSVIRNSESRYGVSITRLVRGREVGGSYLNSWSLQKFKFSVVRTSEHLPMGCQPVPAQGAPLG